MPRFESDNEIERARSISTHALGSVRPQVDTSELGHAEDFAVGDAVVLGLQAERVALDPEISAASNCIGTSTDVPFAHEDETLDPAPIDMLI